MGLEGDEDMGVEWVQDACLGNLQESVGDVPARPGSDHSTRSMPSYPRFHCFTARSCGGNR